MTDETKQKHAGGRPKEAKNKPKSPEKLIAELRAQGYEVNVDTGVISIPHPAKKELLTEQPEQPFLFNLYDLGDEEGDTFKCGNCGAKLEGEVEICPVCSQKLRWE